MANKHDLSIAFWNKDNGKTSMSIKHGLSEEQVAMFKDLKPGDRLILFFNDRKGATQPNYNLRVFNPEFARAREDGDGY